MRILAAGSRGISPLDRAFDGALKALDPALKEVPEDIAIVHGAARGVDASAGLWARRRGYEVEEYPADWKRFGKAAGMMRNEEMVKSGLDAAIIFWDEESRGTYNTMLLLKEANVPRVIVVCPTGPPRYSVGNETR